ncbi:MAG TPA: CusA/CzcA family heavy metal efflux RND transporter [Steroidobacteraceae bacterium]|jgi:cobalt-zinc-cadmium resistance protein CzcA|nr:CusA/CzcA family heavy metal efflux RND transporter [Steroidobacteraceae bacterium]
MNAIIATALRQRTIMLMLLFGVLIAGAVSYARLNIEAYPDPVPPLVDIVTQSSGQSAEEIERYITIPIEIQMAGIPNVTAVRSISLFGLSDVKLQFTYAYTYQQAEQWVINRLAQLAPLPNGAQPQISPESPIGEIYRYRVVGPPGYSPMDAKTLEDWVLERRFKAVPGVVDVTGWGGLTKAYEIDIDQRLLEAHQIALPQLLQVLGNSDLNVGGQTIDIGPQSAVVRGIGLIHSLDDIRNTMVASVRGLPVLVRDVATVQVSHEPRLGIAGQDDDDDIVQGIVLMRRGEQSIPTIRAIEAQVRYINSSGLLPPGVHIERIYDRSDLIHVTTRTVVHNLVSGVLLIFLVQWLFLGNLRSALIVATTIPFALSLAVAMIVLSGQSANLLSVGAIDFGLIVDASVLMVEAIYRHLAERGGAQGAGGARDAGASLLQQMHDPGAFGLTRTKDRLIAAAAGAVSRDILFAACIIIAGFVPLFTLSGIEGHIFGPMARTYGFAILGGLIATFTICPALCALILPEAVTERETLIVRALRRVYEAVLPQALQHRGLVVAGLGAVALLAVLAARTLGLEFLPALEEGNLWIRAEMPPSISLEEGNGYVNRMRRIIKSFPEVRTVVSQHGRPDDGTDATGFFNAEFFAPLKDASQWPHGMSKSQLTAQMNSELQGAFPGVDFNFSQYIQDNVEEAASGVKGENSVKLYGNDLPTLERYGTQIKNVLATVPGITDLAVLNSLGQPTVQITVKRASAARYGLAPGDVDTAVQAAIGGASIGDLYEAGSDRHFPIRVRLSAPYRDSLAAIRRITIAATDPSTSNVSEIPLDEVADVQLVSGASFIYREQQERYLPIKFSVRGRDLGGAVLEAQRKVAAQLHLPGGYRLEWVGEFGNLQDAIGRLEVVVPLSLLLIALLLYFNFGSLNDVWLAASVIPMAMMGGIFALFISGTAFSVSAAIGFVALFGIATMDGIIVLSHYNQGLATGLDRREAMLQSCHTQMRPVLMTCVVAGVGLVPAALSTGIGSQVQRPLAIVVVGGMLLAPVLILMVLPALVMSFSRRPSARVVTS